MEYIALVVVSALAVYYAYTSYMFFSGIINKRKVSYKELFIKMIVVALVSYGVLALAVNIIKPSVFLKPLLIVGTIISFEKAILEVAAIVLAIKYFLIKGGRLS